MFILTNQALANSQNFEGAAALIGVENASYSTKLTSSESAIDASNELGRSQIFAVANLQYLKSVNDKWLLGGGASYDLDKQDVGQSHNFTGTDYRGYARTKNHYSIYFQPTYATSSDTALFAKLGYHSARLTFSDIGGQLISNFGPDQTKSLNGVGYGFGFMHFLNSNFFVKGEVEFVNYQKVRMDYASDKKATLKLDSTAGILSLGYKF